MTLPNDVWPPIGTHVRVERITDSRHGTARHGTVRRVDARGLLIRTLSERTATPAGWQEELSREVFIPWTAINEITTEHTP